MLCPARAMSLALAVVVYSSRSRDERSMLSGHSTGQSYSNVQCLVYVIAAKTVFAGL